MKDFTEVTKFRSVLPDGKPEDAVDPKKVKKLYICSGQLYYELLDKRNQTKRTVRLYHLGYQHHQTRTNSSFPVQ